MKRYPLNHATTRPIADLEARLSDRRFSTPTDEPAPVALAYIAFAGVPAEPVGFAFDLSRLDPSQGFTLGLDRVSSRQGTARARISGSNRQGQRLKLSVKVVAPGVSGPSLLKASVEDQLQSVLGTSFSVAVELAPALEKSLLTPSEIDILRLRYRGLTAKEIAKYRGCSHRTVEKHIENITQKAGVTKMVPAMLQVMEECFNLDPPPLPPRLAR